MDAHVEGDDMAYVENDDATDDMAYVENDDATDHVEGEYGEEDDAAQLDVVFEFTPRATS